MLLHILLDENKKRYDCFGLPGSSMLCFCQLKGNRLQVSQHSQRHVHYIFHVSVLHFYISPDLNCMFCLSCPQQTSSGEERLRMCVAVKKKLQLYYWKDREFHELQVSDDSAQHDPDLEFLCRILWHVQTPECFLFVCQGDFGAPDIPKSMAWCENSICVGFKRDYYLIRVRATGKEVFVLQLSTTWNDSVFHFNTALESLEAGCYIISSCPWICLFWSSLLLLLFLSSSDVCSSNQLLFNVVLFFV